LGVVYKDIVSLCDGFNFDAVSGPQPGSFLLHGQKKRTLKAGIKNQRKGRPDDETVLKSV